MPDVGENMRKKGMLEVSKTILVLLALLGSINAGIHAEDYSSSVDVNNSAPFIDAHSFSMKIFLEEEVYPTGVRGGARIPYAFQGEALKFNVSVSDDNGDQDIQSASIVLSEDDTPDGDDLTVPLKAVEDERDGDSRLAFRASWMVSSSAQGLKKILVTSMDANGSEATNNGVIVGEVFLNPTVHYEIKSGDEALASVSFEGGAGDVNVNARENPITINNTDPDKVGIKIRVRVWGTDLTNKNGEGVIPISNMKANGMKMSSEPQLLFVVDSGNTETLEFTLDFPIPLPAGSYKGTVKIEVELM